MSGAPSSTKSGEMVPPVPAVDVDESTLRLGRSATFKVSLRAHSYWELCAETRISKAEALEATAT